MTDTDPWGLEQEAPEARLRAAASLGRAREIRAAPSLCMLLGDADARVRAGAAEALGLIGDPRGVGPLVGALGDPDRWVRGRAAEALGRLGDPRAMPALLAALADPAVYHSWTAAALGRLEDRRAVPGLIEALDHPDEAMRFHAARALGELGDARAALPLIRALQGRDASAREAAAEALGRLALCEPVPALRAALPVLRWRGSPWTLETEEAGRTYREAAARIQAATDGTQDLPVPVLAARGPEARRALPRPAARVPCLDDLPLPGPAPVQIPAQRERLSLAACVRRWLEAGCRHRRVSGPPEHTEGRP